MPLLRGRAPMNSYNRKGLCPSSSENSLARSGSKNAWNKKNKVTGGASPRNRPTTHDCTMHLPNINVTVTLSITCGQAQALVAALLLQLSYRYSSGHWAAPNWWSGDLGRCFVPPNLRATACRFVVKPILEAQIYESWLHMFHYNNCWAHDPMFELSVPWFATTYII